MTKNSKVGEYEDLNHIAVRDLVGDRVAAVFIPTSASIRTGDEWTMVSLSFVDGDGEYQSLSAFEESVKPEVWDRLVRFAEDWDSLTFKAVFVEKLLVKRNGEYLNVNPARSSDVVVGKSVGAALRSRGLRE